MRAPTGTWPAMGVQGIPPGLLGLPRPWRRGMGQVLQGQGVGVEGPWAMRTQAEEPPSGRQRSWKRPLSS